MTLHLLTLTEWINKSLGTSELPNGSVTIICKKGHTKKFIYMFLYVYTQSEAMGSYPSTALKSQKEGI